MTVSTTRTTTYTSTVPKIVYVTRKVQADLLGIIDTYGYFTADYVQQLIHDIRVFLDEEVVDRVRFIWTRPGSNYVLHELEYVVIASGIGLADDRAGGTGYRAELVGAYFFVRVHYNTRWQDMGEAARNDVRQGLSLTWSPGGELDYSGGQRTAERAYSRDGYGLQRYRFER